MRYRFLLLLAMLPGLMLLTTSTQADEEVYKNNTDDRRDLTDLKRIAPNQRAHESSGTVFTTPKEWEEIRDHRMYTGIRREREVTIFGVQRLDRKMVSTIYWIPLNPIEKFSDYIRDTASNGEYGEEYETLRVIYGDKNISKPVKMSVGGYDVQKVSIYDGHEKGGNFHGALYAFEVTGKNGKWMVKVRVSFPKGERDFNEKFGLEVIEGFASRTLPAPKQ